MFVCCAALLCSALRFLFCVLRLFNFSPGPTGTKEPKSRRAYIDYRINLMFGLHHPVPYTVCVCVCVGRCVWATMLRNVQHLSPIRLYSKCFFFFSFQLEWMDGWMDGAEHSINTQLAICCSCIHSSLTHECESSKVIAQNRPLVRWFVFFSFVVVMNFDWFPILSSLQWALHIACCGVHTHTHTRCRVSLYTYIIEISLVLI